jgi:hypothetical protein
MTLLWQKLWVHMLIFYFVIGRMLRIQKFIMNLIFSWNASIILNMVPNKFYCDMDS